MKKKKLTSRNEMKVIIYNDNSPPFETLFQFLLSNKKIKI